MPTQRLLPHVAVVSVSSPLEIGADRAPQAAADVARILESAGYQVLQLGTVGTPDEAIAAGHAITRLVVAFEAGRDGFWLARWLRSREVEAYVIHPTSIPVSRERRRAKTDRLDIGLLKRSLLGWLRGEKKHASMAAIPTLEEEDAKRPTREREQLVGKRTGIVNRMKAALVRLGIRGFNPKLRKAPERLATLRTPEGCPFHPTHWPSLHARWRICGSSTQADRGRAPAAVETRAATRVKRQSPATTTGQWHRC